MPTETPARRATSFTPARAAIVAEVAANGLPESELRKARTRIRAAFVFMLESNLSRANQLAEFELVSGDASQLPAELQNYLAVTNEDIKRVAARYLVEANRTELLVVPSPSTGETP